LKAAEFRASEPSSDGDADHGDVVGAGQRCGKIVEREGDLEPTDALPKTSQPRSRAERAQDPEIVVEWARFEARLQL
jgi:hypothetical protein